MAAIGPILISLLASDRKVAIPISLLLDEGSSARGIEHALFTTSRSL